MCAVICTPSVDFRVEINADHVFSFHFIPWLFLPWYRKYVRKVFLTVFLNRIFLNCFIGDFEVILNKKTPQKLKNQRLWCWNDISEISF